MIDENSAKQGETTENQNEPGDTLARDAENTVPAEEIKDTSLIADDGEITEAAEHIDHKGKKKHKKSADKELEVMADEIRELKDKYLRLYSEFENYRKRTSREKLEMIRTAGEDVLFSMLPVIDDLERAISSMNETDKTSKEGIILIYNKLKSITEIQGLKVMPVEKGAEFNPEFHEAITRIPVEDEKLKGKIAEVLEKGYYLHEKVIRFAKVVMGS